MRRLLGPLVAGLALALPLVAACGPEIDARPSLIDGPRLLAIRSEPAEVRPGDSAIYTVLLASPDPDLDGLNADAGDGGRSPAPDAGGAAPAWAFCLAPKPVDENNVVAAACLGDEVSPIDGAAATVSGVTPVDGCALFGPEVPSPRPGNPAPRPRDPDATGGYFQPVRVTVAALTGFGLQRITCDLAGASSDVVADFRARYTANKNPTLLAVSATSAGAAVDLARIPAGQPILFHAGWSPDSVERFPVYNPIDNVLVDQWETMDVSWFATDGAFAFDRTSDSGSGSGGTAPDFGGVGGLGDMGSPGDATFSTENAWIAPATPGAVHLWIVLRDSRGGIDFLRSDVNVVSPGSASSAD